MNRLLQLTALTAALALAGPAAAFDHSALESILKDAVKGTKVDYKAVAAKRDVLQGYLKTVATADAKAMAKTERAAFYVNAYNAYVLDAVLENKLPGSGKGVLDVAGFFDKKTYTVAGQSLTLNKLEEKVRPPNGSASVHFVVNCASISCPPLASTVYTAANYKKMLASQAAKYLKRDVQIDDEKKTITVVKLFEWYQKDFGGEDGVRKYLAAFGFKQAADPAYKIVTREYDWRLNAR